MHNLTHCPKAPLSSSHLASFTSPTWRTSAFVHAELSALWFSLESLPGELLGDLQSLVLSTAPHFQVGLSNIAFEVLTLMCLLPCKVSVHRRNCAFPVINPSEDLMPSWYRDTKHMEQMKKHTEHLEGQEETGRYRKNNE